MQTVDRPASGCESASGLIENREKAAFFVSIKALQKTPFFVS